LQVHCAILRRFILCAFDKAREIQITPRRMRYALEKETELYRALVAMASEKQAEITDLIANTLESMQSELVEEAAQYQYRGWQFNIFYPLIYFDVWSRTQC